eukprot:gene11317-21507_t
MRAVRVSQFGGPEVLQVLKDVKVPTPAGKEVLIKVKAAGINPVDTYIRSGNYARKPFLPYTPGGDGAGIVHEVGSDVSKFKAGDRVWFYGSLSGSYAEYSLSSESKLFSLPDAVDFDRGAAIGVPYLTAYRALFHKCHAKAGETVLIHGASGGVGIAASQLAVAAGLRVLGTVGSAEGKQILKENHVHEVFNHRLEGYVDEIMAATSGNGVDIIIEMLANVNLGNDLKMLAKNGRVGVIGSRGVVEVNPRDAMAREASIHGVMLFNSSQLLDIAMEEIALKRKLMEKMDEADKRFENSIQGIANSINSLTAAITGGFNLLQGMLNAGAYQQPYQQSHPYMQNYEQQRPDYGGQTAYRDIM